MIASSAITITSHNRAIDAPSPTAGPFNAQTIGTSTSSRSHTICLASRRSSFRRSGTRSAGNHAMSPPAEKAVPDPVITIARASPSCLSVENSSARSRWSSASTALSADRGWSITTSSTSPLRSSVIVSIRRPYRFPRLRQDSCGPVLRNRDANGGCTAQNMAVSTSTPRRSLPIVSFSFGAVWMCWVTTWASRSARPSRLVSYTAVPPARV